MNQKVVRPFLGEKFQAGAFSMVVSEAGSALCFWDNFNFCSLMMLKIE